jgi:murein DD-endopeptidase MepM/ murein hydrolase activator NlpD
VVALFGGLVIYTVSAQIRIGQLQARLAREDQVQDVGRSREEEMRRAILSQRAEANTLKQEYANLTQEVQSFRSDVTDQVEGFQTDVQTEVSRIQAGMDEIDRMMSEIRGIVGLEPTPTPTPETSGEAQPETPSQSESINLTLEPPPVPLRDGLGGSDILVPASLDASSITRHRISTLEELRDLEAQLPAKMAELQWLKEEVTARVEQVDASKRSSPTEIERQLRLIAAAPKGWPAFASLTSHFGWRYFGRSKDFHTGLDIGVYYRTPVHVPMDGVVGFAGWQRGYGWTVEIKHSMGFSTLYGHLSRTLVNVGDEVSAGDVIALTGSSGRSTGPHLHYEIRLNGIPIDPLKYVNMKD